MDGEVGFDNMADVDRPPACPRRSRKLTEATIKKNKTSLEILVQMGFPKPRAEKALAATGDTGVQMASDWLLSHVNDPSLDEKAPREYILYLCPVGQLQQQLIDFWHKSFQECGWNRAHNYFPHVTLCTFFKADDSQVPLMAHMLKSVVDRFKKLPDTIGLEYFSSNNFIGLFISESSSAFIKQLTANFSEEAKKIGVNMEPHKKQLHISLAYQFPPDKKDTLEAVAKCINLILPVRWDIRLYSRDSKLTTCQVRKVLYSHNPTDADELELVDGDYIFVENSEIEQSTDSWYHGTSWVTGLQGMFPGPFTERCAESEVWTMHRAIPVVGAQPKTPTDANGLMEEDEEEEEMEVDNSSNPPVIPPRASIPMIQSSSSSKHNKPPAKTPTPAVRQPHHQLSQPQQQKQQQVKPQQQQKQQPKQQTGSAGNSNDNASHKKLEKSGVGTSILAPSPAERPRHSPQSQSSQAPGPPQPPMPHIQPKNTAKGPPPGPPPDAIYAKVNKNKPSISHSHTLPVGGAIPKVDKNNPSSQNCAGNPVGIPAIMSTSAPAFDGLNDDLFSSNPSSSKQASVTDVNASHNRVGDTIRGVSHPQGPRQLYVIRHGERIDFTFGKEWIKNSFDKHGNYIRYDLNMPKKMPKRKGGPQDFSKDSPLTIQGHFQARLIGEAMKEKGIVISHIYASPSLRCVQTASSILEGLGKEKPIYMEPGLFEWLGWYQSGLPNFMTEAEFLENGFKVARNHEPIWNISKYNMQETTEQYYERCHHVTKEILRKHDSEGQNILCIAHKGSLDVFTRQLRGKKPRPRAEFRELLSNVPFCAVGCAREKRGLLGRTWELCDPGIPPLTHKGSTSYDWRIWI